MYKRGFTVLELTVILGMIAILVGIVLVSFTQSRERARDNVRIAGINNVMLALEQYRAVCRNYPANLDDITDPHTCSSKGLGGTMSLDKFIHELPPLPNNETYTYRSYAFPGTPNQEKVCTHYHIFVTLEDENNDAFGEDSDYNGATNLDFCTGSDTNGFNGLDTNQYYDFYR